MRCKVLKLSFLRELLAGNFLMCYSFGNIMIAIQEDGGKYTVARLEFNERAG
jgi:hypothetical protein